MEKIYTINFNSKDLEAFRINYLEGLARKRKFLDEDGSYDSSVYMELDENQEEWEKGSLEALAYTIICGIHDLIVDLVDVYIDNRKVDFTNFTIYDAFWIHNDYITMEI